MSLGHGPNIVTSDLRYYLDPANPKCYSGSGTTVNDLSTYGLNSDLINGGVVSNGVFVLDGANDYLNRSYTFDWTSTPWSVSFFANAADFQWPTVIDLIAAGNGHFRFDLRNDRIRSRFRTPGGSSSDLVNYTTTINSNQWYHCAFTRSGTTFKAYLNGVLVATNTNNNFSGTSGMSVIRIGYSSDYDASDRTFEGSVGPVMIHTKQLSDSEVLQNFSAQKGRFGL